MPTVTFHKAGAVFHGEVKENTNLVVRAGIKQFPFPHLRYQCGMGKCATCACRVLGGAEHLPGMLAAKTIVPVLGVPVAS